MLVLCVRCKNVWFLTNELQCNLRHKVTNANSRICAGCSTHLATLRATDSTCTTDTPLPSGEASSRLLEKSLPPFTIPEMTLTAMPAKKRKKTKSTTFGAARGGSRQL